MNFHLGPALARRIREAPSRLAFQNHASNFAQWQAALSARLRELLGLPEKRASTSLLWETEEVFEHGVIRRFSYSPEPDVHVPAYFLTPKNGLPPFPVAICLQGHSSGMHISLGRPVSDGDRRTIKGGRDFAIQAVRRGYAAAVIEQRGFGERRYGDAALDATGCHHAAMNALITGRTLLGERVLDVMGAIDAIAPLPEVDAKRLFCLGNSGGGTVSYYASAVDSRIHLTVPSCAVCEYGDSIAPIHHCACNYLPHALEWFEMSDLAGLIAPRPLIVVAGRQDPIFPYAGVLRSFANIEAIYHAAGAEGKCRLVIGPEGHRFYPEEAWPIIEELLQGTQPYD